MPNEIPTKESFTKPRINKVDNVKYLNRLNEKK